MKDQYFETRFRDALAVAGCISNWDDNSFDWAKCYVAAVMSEAAYHEVPGFELRDETRAKLIPCDVYQRLYALGRAVSARTALLSIADNQQVRVIVRREVVAVVARLHGVIFVAFRGTTRCIDDLVTDTKAWKHYSRFGPGADRVGFHSGFFGAVAQGFMEVCDAIEQLDPTGTVPLYVVGHSLGGAMTAIFSLQVRWSYRFRPSPRITAEYVFGAPRYCDAAALFVARPPYQICNQYDAVPSIPPRRLGYIDPPGTSFLRADGSLLDEVDRGDMFRAWRDGVETSLSFAEHRLDRYVERCEAKARKVSPKSFASGAA